MKRKTPLFSLSRAELLSLINNHDGLTILELSQLSGLSRTNVYHHLEHLEKNGLIIQTKFRKKKGQPVIITTNKANPLSLKMINLFKAMQGLESQRGSVKRDKKK